MLRVGAALVLIAVALAALAPGDALARQLRRIGSIEEETRLADGSRYTLSAEDWGLRIVDTVNGRRTAFDYTQITGTEYPYSCYPGEADHGLVVVNCPDPKRYGDSPWVVDLASREAVTPPGERPLGDYSQTLDFGWVGTYWIVSDESRTGDGWTFWNWRTGAVAYASASQERVPRDLDTPKLAVRPPELAARNGQRSVWERNGRLTLRDPERRVRLGACPCSATVALSGGRVAWISGRLLESYRIRNGSRIRWRIPGEGSDCESRRLSYTRNRLYVKDFCEGGLYVAKWPTD
jgi:hypothetical protein